MISAITLLSVLIEAMTHGCVRDRHLENRCFARTQLYVAEEAKQSLLSPPGAVIKRPFPVPRGFDEALSTADQSERRTAGK